MVDVRFCHVEGGIANRDCRQSEASALSLLGLTPRPDIIETHTPLTDTGTFPMSHPTQELLAEEIESIREILVQHGRLPVDAGTLEPDGDLYSAGLTSLATVGVMLAIEDKFDVEFPESLLNRGTFRSILSIAEAVHGLVS